MTLLGYALYLLGAIVLGRAIHAMKAVNMAKENDTFPQ